MISNFTQRWLGVDALGIVGKGIAFPVRRYYTAMDFKSSTESFGPTGSIKPVAVEAHATLGATTAHSAKRKTPRDLSSAEYFRPREIFELYGIPTSSLSQLCTHKDPAKRLPSLKIRGRCGRKGMRLIRCHVFLEWLKQFRQTS